MAVNMSIDLDNATFADLVALVDAARVAGVADAAPVKLDGAALSIEVDTSARASQAKPARTSAPAESADTSHRPLPQLGDAAIRSVVDILTGRQEPPRR
ncbi:hypothetical protein V6D40_08355 [Corynebacterium sp. Q4381]|uniref:hypothetical protein n=1 Tax=Corynebacterium sp. Marseille-Q4381 TaxID=3121597 RepID=UPI002FE66261